MWRSVAILLIALTSQLSYAANNIVGVMVVKDDTSDIVQIDLSQPLKKPPADFVVQTTNKIVIDLDDVGSRVPRKNQMNFGNILSVDVIKVDDRVRIVINLTRELSYKINVVDDKIIVSTDVNKTYPIVLASSKTSKELIESARLVVEDGSSLKDAVDSLNELLLLPPNEYTEEAQELIGIIYEKTGQYEKAKAENKVFLVLYPNSTRVQRVKERLIALEIAEPERKTNIAAPKKPKQGKDSKVDASIAEYYVLGGSQMGDSAMQKDQESLISNFRADGFFRDDQYQLKLALRAARIDNILTPSASKDLLMIGYADVEDTFRDRGIRIGRQNASHGAIGRFDGVLASSGNGEGNRIYLLAGSPYIGPTGSKRQFYGASYDALFDDVWSGEVYYNFQTADDITERSAIGGNVRYFKNNWSGMVAAEYDTIYQAFNAITLQANGQMDPYNYYFLMDRRKSPMLFAERSLLIGLNTTMKQPFSTVGDTFRNSGLSSEDIYRFINNSTAVSNAYVLGVGKQLNPTWNVSVDYQITNLSSAEDTSFVPTIDNPFSLIQQPATDDTHSVNFHVLGTDVLTKGHTVNGLVMRSWDSSSVTHTLTLLNGIQFSNLRVDLMLMYVNRDQTLMSMTNTSASIRTNYKLTSSAIETQFTLTDSRTVDKLQGFGTKSLSASFVLGWKIDF